jgi:3-dehydroquinate dehydratase-2
VTRESYQKVPGTILLVHGPNLNLLGEREPKVYGKTTLAEINARFKGEAKKLGLRVLAFQSNSEGALIDFLHKNRKRASGLVINPGAYTHYSYALRDAIAATELPAVEVHLSDIKKREPFRRVSVIRDVCIAQVSGLGPRSYSEGLKILSKTLLGSKGKTAKRPGSRAR